MAFKNLLGKLYHNLKKFNLFKNYYNETINDSITVDKSNCEYLFTDNFNKMDNGERRHIHNLALLANSYISLNESVESAKKMSDYTDSVNEEDINERKELIHELNEGMKWKYERRIQNYARCLSESIDDYKKLIWIRESFDCHSNGKITSSQISKKEIKDMMRDYYIRLKDSLTPGQRNYNLILMEAETYLEMPLEKVV